LNDDYTVVDENGFVPPSGGSLEIGNLYHRSPFRW